MTTRIIPQIVSLSLLVCAARAADEAPLPVCTIDPVVIEVTPVVDPVIEPVVVVCPGVDEVAVKTDVEDPQIAICPVIEEPQVAICPVIEEEVVKCDVGDVRHYSGSEVERGGGDVDPVIMYSTGIMTLGGGASGGAGLEQGISGSGIAAVAALKVDIAEVALPARELKVLDTAGDIVISD